MFLCGNGDAILWFEGFTLLEITFARCQKRYSVLLTISGIAKNKTRGLSLALQPDRHKRHGDLLAPPDLREARIGTVEHITPEGMTAGAIYERFATGAKLVCLKQDPRVQQLWTSLVQDGNDGSHFWQGSIFELAQNHIAGEARFGDMLRFAPGQYGHIARKIGFYPDATSGRFLTYPEYSEYGDNLRLRQQDILRLAWDLALDVLQSASPTQLDPSIYAVTIQLLKYPESGQDLQSVFDLIGDSASGWTRLGLKVDSARAAACGPFDRRLVKDLFGWMSIIPGFGGWLRSINDKFDKGPSYVLNRGEIMIGAPHTDGSRHLTMLAGNRDVMTTEVYDDGTWIEIPMETTTLSIFPGELYEQDLDVQPSLHRYTIKRERRTDSQGSPNLTLVVGVMPRRLMENSD